MANLALVLSVVMLVSTGLAAVSPEKKLQTAMKEVTVDPEQEYECLLFRLEDRHDRMMEKIAKIEKQLKRIPAFPISTQPGNATQYAFSAYLSDTNTLHTSGTLKFTKTISNVGGCFNEHTGVFKSEVDGVYVFHFHGNTYTTSRHCTLSLLHQNRTIASTYDYDSYGYSLLSNTAVIELKKTDVVQIAVMSPVSTSYCYLRGKFTTFSGFKI